MRTFQVEQNSLFGYYASKKRRIWYSHHMVHDANHLQPDRQICGGNYSTERLHLSST
jgi:hypothetical protein